MDYMSTAQAAEKWGISERRVQKYCEDGRIEGAFRFSRVWAIPKDAAKPTDPRKKIPIEKSKSINEG
jgi:predicted site-specific integrase-resolvase